MTYKYHATGQSVDNLCQINDDDEFPKFFKCIFLYFQEY